MYRAEQIVADRSLSKRQQQRFVDWSGRSLSRRIKLANGFDFVPEELDTERTVSLGRVHIKNAATESILTRHFHDISRGISNRIQMTQQRFNIKRLAPSNHARQAGVVFGGTKTQRRRRNGRHQNRDCACRDFPQRNGTFFLDFRVWGKILKWQNVAGWKRNHRIGIVSADEFVEGLQHRHKFFSGAIILNHYDERASGAFLQQNQQQSFGGGSESGDTYSPCTLAEVGGYT